MYYDNSYRTFVRETDEDMISSEMVVGTHSLVGRSTNKTIGGANIITAKRTSMVCLIKLCFT